MKETYDKLIHDLDEEMEAAVEYHNMAAELEKKGCAECVFLMEMARDEMNHASWIHEYLVKSGVQIPKEKEDKFNSYMNAHKF